MEILFVSGALGGGATASTVELARELAARGDRVGMLRAVRPGRFRRSMHKRLLNAVARLHCRPLRRAAAGVASRFGTRIVAAEHEDGMTVWHSAFVGNGALTALKVMRPEIVVVNSVDRATWRRVHAVARVAGVPVVLYMREESALGNLVDGMPTPDGLFANSRTLVARAAELGFDATFVPSVTNLRRTRVEPRRERIVYINPVPGGGVDTAFAIATASPELEFAFVESWKIEPDAWRALEDRVAPLRNVTLFRRAEDVRTIYAMASVLLVPYLWNGRPRVVLEAQDSGIPVVASGVDALVEAVGPGGLTVALEASTADWVSALHAVLDPAAYATWCDAARDHAQREEVAVTPIVDAFRSAVELVVTLALTEATQ